VLCEESFPEENVVSDVGVESSGCLGDTGDGLWVGQTEDVINDLERNRLERTGHGGLNVNALDPHPLSSCRSCCGRCRAHTFCVCNLADLYPPRKPKNARSKRALEARQPKEAEDPRTVIFVKGTHTGERLNGAMQELVGREHPFHPPLCR